MLGCLLNASDNAGIQEALEDSPAVAFIQARRISQNSTTTINVFE